MKNLVIMPLGAVIVMAAIAMGNAQAREVSYDNGVTPFATKVKKRTGRGQTKFLPGSAETVRERSARLQRECRGGVNAGACAGYTR